MAGGTGSDSPTLGPADLDQIDRQILRLLRDDGRRANAEIARLIGVSEPTVRKRLERMRRQGVLQVLAILNPAATGYPVDAILGIRVEPGLAQDVGRRLAAMDHVAYVGFVTGQFDLIIEVLLTTTDELFRFLTDELGRIGGITSTETYTVLRTEKFNYMWEIPAEPPGGDAAGD